MENNYIFLKKEDGHVFKYNVYSNGKHIFGTDNSYEAICTAELAVGTERTQREVRVTFPDGIHSKLVYTCSGTVGDDFEEIFPLSR